MKLEGSLSEVPAGPPIASASNADALEATTVDNEAMSVLVESYNPSSPGSTHEAGSDYGDFASDEEEIINYLLEKAVPPSAGAGAPLLVTDIEDYEEPRGVRLPKVLGVERSPPAWLPQVQIQSHDQTVRDRSPSQGTCGTFCYPAAAY